MPPGSGFWKATVSRRPPRSSPRTPWSATRLGTVGPVIPGVEVRIAGDGEILDRGPNVMKGYFRDEEATREAMKDGWLHTGDIGHLDADGFLKITDRKKEMLKTSGGKLVAPQPLENLLKADRFISQAMVVGDRRKFIAALIVPDFAWMESYARHKQIPYREAGELLGKPRVLDLFRRRIEEKMRGFPSYEAVKKFHLLPRELSQEEGDLTPTLKIKRRVVAEKYADLIRIDVQGVRGGPPAVLSPRLVPSLPRRPVISSAVRWRRRWAPPWNRSCWTCGSARGRSSGRSTRRCCAWRSCGSRPGSGRCWSGAGG